MAEEETDTRFERARMIGARALQIAQGAPPLVKTESTDPIMIARQELAEGKIPVSVSRSA